MGFLLLMMYRPLASGIVAANIWAFATSLTSTITGVPAITSLSRQAYCTSRETLSDALSHMYLKQTEAAVTCAA